MSYSINHCTCKEVLKDGSFFALQISPDVDYTIRIKQDDDYIYSSGMQIPSRDVGYLFPLIDAILTKDVPVPVPEIEVDSDTALNELEEVINDEEN